MIERYQTSYSASALSNAQNALQGRTHYVDSATLRFHKSRVISARATDEGLLFAIVTKDALDFENSRRGYRFVVFDVFGHVVARTDIESAFRTRAQCEKAMWQALNGLDAKELTRLAIAREEKHFADDMQRLRDNLNK